MGGRGKVIGERLLGGKEDLNQAASVNLGMVIGPIGFWGKGKESNQNDQGTAKTNQGGVGNRASRGNAGNEGVCHSNQGHSPQG